MPPTTSKPAVGATVPIPTLPFVESTSRYPVVSLKISLPVPSEFRLPEPHMLQSRPPAELFFRCIHVPTPLVLSIMHWYCGVRSEEHTSELQSHSFISY